MASAIAGMDVEGEWVETRMEEGRRGQEKKRRRGGAGRGGEEERG